MWFNKKEKYIPKLKVGDKVVHKSNDNYLMIVTSIDDDITELSLSVECTWMTKKGHVKFYWFKEKELDKLQ